MTKTEALEKLNRIACAVEALPDGANPISVYICGMCDQIQLSSDAETPPASEEVDDWPYTRYCAEVLGVPVVWVRP